MALRALADQPEKALLSAREITDSLHIPYDNVAKALQKFTKLGLAESVQGVTGGYRLRTEAMGQVTLLAFIEALQGPMGIVRCQVEGESCEHHQQCNVSSPLQKLGEQFLGLLRNQTLNEFFGARSKSSPDIASSKDDFAVWG
jgi:Rrf2 family protein